MLRRVARISVCSWGRVRVNRKVALWGRIQARIARLRHRRTVLGGAGSEMGVADVAAGECYLAAVEDGRASPSRIRGRSAGAIQFRRYLNPRRPEREFRGRGGPAT